MPKSYTEREITTIKRDAFFHGRVSMGAHPDMALAEANKEYPMPTKLVPKVRDVTVAGNLVQLKIQDEILYRRVPHHTLGLSQWYEVAPINVVQALLNDPVDLVEIED